MSVTQVEGTHISVGKIDTSKGLGLTFANFKLKLESWTANETDTFSVFYAGPLLGLNNLPNF